MRDCGEWNKQFQSSPTTSSYKDDGITNLSSGETTCFTCKYTVRILGESRGTLNVTGVKGMCTAFVYLVRNEPWFLAGKKFVCGTLGCRVFRNTNLRFRYFRKGFIIEQQHYLLTSSLVSFNSYKLKPDRFLFQTQRSGSSFVFL